VQTRIPDPADTPEPVPASDWNELQFVSWSEFRQMTPSILRLEITRMGKLIQTFRGDTDFHNSLVRARFALEQFVACLERSEKDTLEATCAEHLRAAIIGFPLPSETLDAQTRQTHRYILDRLNYVYHRIRLIY